MATESNNAAPSAVFSAGRIRAATFARHVEIHEALSSTNDRAANLARQQDIELPALVVARRQTAGRGRGKNVWWSAEGALTCSVLIEPADRGIRPANWPQLSLATAVAVCDALVSRIANCKLRNNATNEEPSPRLGIKWPNDVILDGRKVCGILIESPGGPTPAKERLVIGIGVNVNNSFRQAPVDAARVGTALSDSTGRPHDVDDVLIGVLQALQNRLDELERNAPSLSAAWQQRCTLRGRAVAIESGAERLEGLCRGIAADGAILVETASGQRSIYSGRIAAICN